jgi:hypothetical protein
MVDREIINEWISKADEDFEFAKINLQEEKPFILKPVIPFIGRFNFLKTKPIKLSGLLKKSVISLRQNYSYNFLPINQAL